MSFFSTVPPEIARLTDQELAQLLQEALTDIFGFQPVILDRRGVGSGKTQEALQHVVQHVKELSDGEAIYIFAPTKILCEEIRRRLVSIDNDLEKKVLVWGGRAAKSPHNGLPMCHFHEAADAVIKQGGNPAKVLCEARTQKCEQFGTCGYRAQMTMAHRCKIIIQPHAMLPLARRNGMGEPALVLIDEDPYKALLGEEIGIPFDDLIAPIKVPSVGPKATENSDPTLILSSVLQQIHGVLNKADGVVGTDGLPDAEATSSAIKLLYRVGRSSSYSLKPNPTRREVKNYTSSGVVARRAFQLIELLNAIHQSNRNTQIIGCRVSDRKVMVLPKRNLNAAYLSVPTLILSATAQPMILRKWWPRLEAGKLEIADAPHETVVHRAPRESLN